MYCIVIGTSYFTKSYLVGLAPKPSLNSGQSLWLTRDFGGYTSYTLLSRD